MGNRSPKITMVETSDQPNLTRTLHPDVSVVISDKRVSRRLLVSPKLLASSLKHLALTHPSTSFHLIWKEAICNTTGKYKALRKATYGAYDFSMDIRYDTQAKKESAWPSWYISTNGHSRQVYPHAAISVPLSISGRGCLLCSSCRHF